MMASQGRGEREMGLNSKQSRQAPTSTSHALRDVRQSLKQMQVSGHASQTDRSQQMFGNDVQNSASWNMIYADSTSKRPARHKANALMQIKNSLQDYEVGDRTCGDVDKALLDQCVAWGFDEDVAREALRANRDKDFGVVLATLKSLTEVSGRKFAKSIAPGSLQYARNNSPNSTANSNSSTMRTAARPEGSIQNVKGYILPQTSVWNPVATSSQSGNSVYIKSSPLPQGRLTGANNFIRNQPLDSTNKPMSGNEPLRVDRTQFSTGERAEPLRVDRTQFNTGERTEPLRIDRPQFSTGVSTSERKISEGSMNNFAGVRLRQNRNTGRDAQKRWSADVLSKVNGLELANKRSSLAFEVGGDKRNVFDIPNKPPPPYPGPTQNQAGQGDVRYDAWLGGAKFLHGNMKKIPSIENVAKNNIDSPMHSPVTVITDKRKPYVQDIGHQNMNNPVGVIKPHELPMYQNITVGKQMSFRDPPPYHAVPHRPVQKTYSPSDRGNIPQGSRGFNAAASQVNTVQSWHPNENPTNSFVPIHHTDSNYSSMQEDMPPPSHGSPPPYRSLEQRTSSEEKRLSFNSDGDSTASSKRASMVFTDGFMTQSDSSGSTSPTQETIESRCSPLPMTNSPYHTLVVHNTETETSRDESMETKQDTEPFNSRLKSCSTQAFKFYMEQHVENVLKSRGLREKRKKQLEIEMQRVGLSGESQTEMRKMLVQKESNYIRMKRSKMSKSLFAKVKTLGMGAFGEVALVRKIDSNALYAMKTLRKADVLRRNQVAHVKAERDILAEADNEWVVKLYYSFQDETNLYFVMEYVPGGDLMALLIKLGIFSHELARFYTAELVLAVESVHKMGFIHRDIKPDNVLIDRNGHIKLTDFGLCTGFRWTHDSKYYQQDPTHARQPSMEPEGGWEQMLMDGPCDCGDIIKKFDLCKPLDRRAARQHMRCLAHSLVGTPNYIAPEVLLRIPYTQQCDWWSVGVILYEMLVGQPPFLARSPAETQMKVIYWQNSLRIPKQAKLTSEAENLIVNLCVSPEQRLGKHGTDEIRKHPFFDGLNWADGLKSEPAPFIPKIRHATDTSNFDPVPEKEANADNDDRNNEEKREILEKGPQHAFYEFTFRRFFDEGGYPQEITMGDDAKPFTDTTSNGTTSQNNKRSATQSDKSVSVPNKVAAPPLMPGKLDDKAPIYV